MKKWIISLLIIAIILAVIGGALVIKAASDGSYKVETIENEHTIDEAFSNINIKTFSSKIEIKASEDDKCSIKCVEKEKLYHEVTISEDTLVIKQIDNLQFFEKMFGYNGGLSVTLYLPTNVYNKLTINVSSGSINMGGDLKFESMDLKASSGSINIDKIIVNGDSIIKTSSGSINAKNTTFSKTTTIDVSSGHVEFEHIRGESADISVSSGHIDFTDYILLGHLKVKASSGSIKFKDSDAYTLDIKTSSGSVKGNLLTPKTFRTHASSGKEDVPNTSGPLCEINTSSGSIIIEVKGVE